ncbi:uncharacterized protein [Primulina eburnea]|uniref:uncharacterized protein n=1 Tax=Primulina eburnea TaxID=1245227 RepID=UPI003C6BF117
MSGAKGRTELEPFDPEIENTFPRRHRAQREKSSDSDVEEQLKKEKKVETAGMEVMDNEEEDHTVYDLTRQTTGGYGSSITRPTMEANNFELKPSIIQMIKYQVRFGGSQTEDPNAHLEGFLSICDTIKFNGVRTDAIRLRLFPFSLHGEAAEWLRDLPAGSITTWNGLVELFINQYFPPTKLAQLRKDISSIRQKDGETLHTAWGRFRKMLRRCPQHGFSSSEQVQIFYNGVNPFVCSMLDAAANGSLYRKIPRVALEIISNMAENSAAPPGFKKEDQRPIYEDFMMKHVVGMETRLQNHDAILRRLDAQMGQIANQLANRPLGTLPSDTEKSTKGVNAVSTIIKAEEEEPKRQNSIDLEENNDGGVESKTGDAKEQNTHTTPTQKTCKKGKEFDSNDNNDINTLPFPQRARLSQLDHQFSKFLEVFKKLHINIPFADAFAQMPSYAKFLKDILTKKRKLVDFETVTLSEGCSAILQNKLHPKLKDPGSFSIPCTTGSSNFNKALCDLGASINFMPYSCFEKLGIGEVKPTIISLQLADRSIKYPRGVIDDVLVKVDKFIFPVDFVVLDMEEDREIPLILGRPFLATGRALIDVQIGELVLRLNDEKVTFNVFRNMKYPVGYSDYYRIDAIDDIVGYSVHDTLIEYPLEIILVNP